MRAMTSKNSSRSFSRLCGVTLGTGAEVEKQLLFRKIEVSRDNQIHMVSSLLTYVVVSDDRNYPFLAVFTQHIVKDASLQDEHAYMIGELNAMNAQRRVEQIHSKSLTGGSYAKQRRDGNDGRNISDSTCAQPPPSECPTTTRS